MLKGFGTILFKELKELIRDPKILLGMIIVPLVMFPVLGLVLGYAVETAQEQAQEAVLLVVNNDGGNWSQEFIGYLDIAMNVADIEKSIDFYRRAFGFETVRRWGEQPRAAMLDMGDGTLLEIFERPEASRGVGMLLHIAVRTDDVDAAFA